ncbi:hypothetical protein N7486_011020 [Penicillium sp. IBT 16267x]|nr:hypothetical protein N7486_011020 [Penicillium sp. IBT 16267x]
MASWDGRQSDFFSVHVPIRANDNSTLKYALASITAKHLGRVGKRRYSVGFNTSAGLEIHAITAQVDWSSLAVNYYRMATAERSHSTSSRGTFPYYGKQRRYLQHFGRQLSGIRSLFETIQQLHIDLSPEVSLGIRAALWNSVQLDLFSSYFNCSASNLDSENLTLWRCAGINIDGEGRFQLSLHERGPVREYQAANCGLWLVFKIVNFLAKQKQARLARWPGSPVSLGGRGVPSSSQNPFPDPAVWLRLCFKLQAWVESLPETFRPFLRVGEPKDPSTIEGKPIPEILYGRPACAAAIRHYHFGRIALLLNQPTDPINSLKVEFHAREICGIALGRPPDSVRIFMIPILFAVGQCLENPGEHGLVTNL